MIRGSFKLTSSNTVFPTWMRCKKLYDIGAAKRHVRLQDGENGLSQTAAQEAPTESRSSPPRASFASLHFRSMTTSSSKACNHVQSEKANRRITEAPQLASCKHASVTVTRLYKIRFRDVLALRRLLHSVRQTCTQYDALEKTTLLRDWELFFMVASHRHSRLSDAD